MKADRPEDVSRVRFGAFTLDVLRRGLYRDGERVHLTAKPLDTLIYLVAHRGRTVEKQELLDAIWKDTAVTEDALVQAVGDIRRALDEDKADPRFIQTVPRQGYRFVGQVTRPPAAPDPAIALPPAVASPSPRSRRWLWPAVAIAAVAGVLPLSMWTRRPAASDAAPPPPTVLEQLTPEGLSAGKPALSSQGNLLYNSGGALYLKVARGETSLRITDPIFPSGDMPVFTADGGHVVFSLPRNGSDGSRMYDLYKVGSIGGPPEPFMSEASGAGFSPDGRWVAYTKHLPGRDPLWISSVDRLDRHVELRARGFVPRWSPDGGAIAYTTADPNTGTGDLWLARIARSEPGLPRVSEHIQLTRGSQAMYGLSWTPDGRSLIFAARQPGGPMHLYQIASSGGVPRALTSGAGDYVCPSVSADGRSVVFWHGAPLRDLAIVDRLDRGEERQITDDEYHLWPSLSPSGTRIASVVRRPNYDEHLYATEIATRKRLALSSERARHPAWIDDRNIAYLAQGADGRTEVRLVDIASGVMPLTLSEFPGEASWPAVHPGRRTIAVALRAADGRQRIVLRSLTGRQPDRTVAEGAEYTHLRWRPDGLALSWSGPERSSDRTSDGIWSVTLDGTRPIRLVEDAYGPVWSRDGTSVYFSRIRERSGLWKFDVRTGTETLVRPWPEGEYEFDIAGERLLFTRPQGRGRIYAMSLPR